MFTSYLTSVSSSASGRARLGLLQVSVTGILWGTTGVVVQVVAERTGLGALAIGFYRLAVAAVVLLVIGFPARSRILAAFRAAPVALIANGVGLATYQGLYFLAVRLGGVSVATVVSLGIAPVLLSAWESLRTRRRPGTPTLIAAAAAIGGLILIATADPATMIVTTEPGVGTINAGEPGTGTVGATGAPHTDTPGATGEPGTGAATGAPHTDTVGAAGETRGASAAGLGLIAAIGSGVVYAVSTAVSRHTTRDVEPLTLTTLSCAVGAVAILPVAAFEGLAFTPSAGPVALLIHAGAISTALAYALFYMGLRHISGSVAVVVTLLEPLTAALLAVLLIGEPLGSTTICGGLLLLGAVATLYLNAGGSTGQPSTAAGTHRHQR